MTDAYLALGGSVPGVYWLTVRGCALPVPFAHLCHTSWMLSNDLHAIHDANTRQCNGHRQHPLNIGMGDGVVIQVKAHKVRFPHRNFNALLAPLGQNFRGKSDRHFVPDTRCLLVRSTPLWFATVFPQKNCHGHNE
jgi:hypothetical protein